MTIRVSRGVKKGGHIRKCVGIDMCWDVLYVCTSLYRNVPVDVCGKCWCRRRNRSERVCLHICGYMPEEVSVPGSPLAMCVHTPLPKCRAEV